MTDKKLTDVTDNNVGKMTDSEIVKALECHLGVDKQRCKHCKYTEYGCYCLDRLHPDLLDLFNRLQAEKQDLEIELKAMRGSANSYKAENERLNAKIENMFSNRSYKKLYDIAKIDIIKLQGQIKTAKAEAYKEFADRLKENICDDFGFVVPSACDRDIDNLLRELVGDK